jgi:hypothetical protein
LVISGGIGSGVIVGVVVRVGVGVEVRIIVDVNVFIGLGFFGISVGLLIVIAVPLVIGAAVQETKTNTIRIATNRCIAFMFPLLQSCLDYSIGYYRKS